MEHTHAPIQADFFLGCLSPTGFRGYFHELARQPGLALWLIKAGPGCGKSTLMKQLTARGRGVVEHIHCSSDPDSLDGAIFWPEGCGIVDATAPHALDPAYPVAHEQVVSLYHTLNQAYLQENREEIQRLFDLCSRFQGRAARYVSAAGGILLDSRRTAACTTDFEKVRKEAARLAARYLPSLPGPGFACDRLLSAVTPQGRIVYSGTIAALTDRQVVLQDETGAASRLLLELLRDAALQKGHRVIVCWCPMAPGDKIDHLIFPDLRLAFVTANSWHPLHFEGQRTIRCVRFNTQPTLSCRRKRLRFNQKAAADLLEQASAMQASAKQNHDLLEEFYKAAADFSQVEAIGRETASAMGLPEPPADCAPAQNTL